MASRQDGVIFPSMALAPLTHTCNVTGQAQSRASVVGRFDVIGQTTAIFEEDHSSSPLLRITVTFFDRTSSAAVSANARFLAQQFAIELLEVFAVLPGGLWAGPGVLWIGQRRGDARAPFVQLGWIDACARHQALLSASRIAAVLSPPRAGSPQSRPTLGRAWTEHLR
ncbi:MAG TPA: hypothetical protein DCP03_11270 [Polaromonas sp.]|nr:hypothetical protein [Polaromonas sp.]